MNKSPSCPNPTPLVVGKGSIEISNYPYPSRISLTNRETSQISKSDERVLYHLAKRFFDVAFSLAAIIFLSPLFLTIALLIRLTSPGKILYLQNRLGHKGKIFKCLKFRTMYIDAEEDLESILKKYPRLKKEWEAKQKLHRDPRIFSFGRFLRKTSLDELPQLWNVLKGDLSIVGPRPYMTTQKNEVGVHITKILSVRPGITGLWQTSGRSQTTFQQRIFLDAAYIDKRSLWYDFILLCKTIPIVIFAKDAC